MRVTIEIPEGVDVELVYNALAEAEDAAHTNAYDRETEDEANRLSEATGLIQRIRDAAKGDDWVVGEQARWSIVPAEDGQWAVELNNKRVGDPDHGEWRFGSAASASAWIDQFGAQVGQ